MESKRRLFASKARKRNNRSKAQRLRQEKCRLFTQNAESVDVLKHLEKNICDSALEPVEMAVSLSSSEDELAVNIPTRTYSKPKTTAVATPISPSQSTSPTTTFAISNTSNILETPDKNSNYALECDIILHATPTKTETCTSLENAFISEEEYNRIVNYPLIVERETYPKVCEGFRIVDLDHVLSWALPLQSMHRRICSGGTLFPVSEDRRGSGLVTKITIGCNMCNKQYQYATEEPKLDTDILKKSKINTGAVWGTLAVGSTHGQLNELLSVMDIPPISYHLFSKIEGKLGTLWDDALLTEMDEAGIEERTIAINNNQVDKDGIPWITVYIDGAWSKRSYGHSYNALSGVAVIIGKATNKVLFVGVRNKYCSICARAANRLEEVKEHVCFRNWSGSSPAMEADIAVEGFKTSISMHGVRYKKFIGDGDSSVYARLRDNVPYGREIEKSECRNHLLKNYTKVLILIKSDTSVPKTGRKLLTAKKIKELEKIVQLAIFENVLEKDVDNLRVDIRNGPLHVYGDHRNCKSYYCDQIGTTETSIIDELKATGIYHHIFGALEAILKRAHRLLDNDTNNRAECFMSIVARFNSGKRLNLIQRGSFGRRSSLACLRYNKGTSWHSRSWKMAISESPGHNFQTFIHKSEHNYEMRTKRKLCEQNDEHLPKRRKTTMPKVKNIDYGPNAEDAQLEPLELEVECERRLKEMQVSLEEQKCISLATIGQFENAQYKAERRDRLTASNFGKVCHMKASTPCHNTVSAIIYPKIITSEAVEFGKRREPVALEIFSKEYKVDVEPSGIFIDVDHGFLAASPDGLIGSSHVVEVKCLYGIHKSGLSLHEAVKNNKSTCLEITNGSMQLKRTHNYYYQIQGQLNICRRDFCYFIVYVNDDKPLHVEEIKRDEEFWKMEMLPKLCLFYKSCILPELICGQIRLGRKCIDPPHILQAMERQEDEKLNRELRKIEKEIQRN